MGNHITNCNNATKKQNGTLSPAQREASTIIVKYGLASIISPALFMIVALSALNPFFLSGACTLLALLCGFCMSVLLLFMTAIRFMATALWLYSLPIAYAAEKWQINLSPEGSTLDFWHSLALGLTEISSWTLVTAPMLLSSFDIPLQAKAGLINTLDTVTNIDFVPLFEDEMVVRTELKLSGKPPHLLSNLLYATTPFEGVAWNLETYNLQKTSVTPFTPASVSGVAQETQDLLSLARAFIYGSFSGLVGIMTATSLCSGLVFFAPSAILSGVIGFASVVAVDAFGVSINSLFARGYGLGCTAGFFLSFWHLSGEHNEIALPATPPYGDQPAPALMTSPPQVVALNVGDLSFRPSAAHSHTEYFINSYTSTLQNVPQIAAVSAAGAVVASTVVEPQAAKIVLAQAVTSATQLPLINQGGASGCVAAPALGVINTAAVIKLGLADLALGAYKSTGSLDKLLPAHRKLPPFAFTPNKGLSPTAPFWKSSTYGDSLQGFANQPPYFVARPLWQDIRLAADRLLFLAKKKWSETPEKKKEEQFHNQFDRFVEWFKENLPYFRREQEEEERKTIARRSQLQVGHFGAWWRYASADAASRLRFLLRLQSGLRLHPIAAYMPLNLNAAAAASKAFTAPAVIDCSIALGVISPIADQLDYMYRTLEKLNELRQDNLKRFELLNSEKQARFISGAKRHALFGHLGYPSNFVSLSLRDKYLLLFNLSDPLLKGKHFTDFLLWSDFVEYRLRLIAKLLTLLDAERPYLLRFGSMLHNPTHPIFSQAQHVTSLFSLPINRRLLQGAYMAAAVFHLQRVMIPAAEIRVAEIAAARDLAERTSAAQDSLFRHLLAQPVVTQAAPDQTPAREPCVSCGSTCCSAAFCWNGLG